MPDSNDKDAIVAYLLGQIDQPDRRRLEERYFTEDELFDQLEAVEHELIDDYLQNRLPEDQRRRFEKRLRDNAHLRKQVEFTRAVQMRCGTPVQQSSPVVAPLRWLVAGAVCLQVFTIGGAIYLYRENQELQRKIVPLSGPLAPLRAAPAVIERLQLSASPVNRDPRQDGNSPVFRLRKDVAAVEITLSFGEPEIGGVYTATLVNAEGQERASHSLLSPRIEDGLGRVTAIFAAAHLPQGSYLIRLNNRRGQTIESFPFGIRFD